jgi:hypothetical protein
MLRNGPDRDTGSSDDRCRSLINDQRVDNGVNDGRTRCVESQRAGSKGEKQAIIFEARALLSLKGPRELPVEIAILKPTQLTYVE